MTYMLFVILLALVGAVGLLAARAVRSEHLVVFSHRGGEVFFMERGEDGLYQLIPPARSPLAVWRFGRQRAGALLRATRGVALEHVPGRPFRALHRSERGARAAHA